MPTRRALRDALGLCRLLYAAEDAHADDASRARAHALHRAGAALGEALGDPRRLLPAVAALDALLALPWPAEVREVLVVAVSRVRPEPDGDGVDPRKRARTMRG